MIKNNDQEVFSIKTALLNHTGNIWDASNEKLVFEQWFSLRYQDEKTGIIT